MSGGGEAVLQHDGSRPQHKYSPKGSVRSIDSFGRTFPQNDAPLELVRGYSELEESDTQVWQCFASVLQSVLFFNPTYV